MQVDQIVSQRKFHAPQLFLLLCLFDMFYSLHVKLKVDFDTSQEPYYSGSQSVTIYFLRFLTMHYLQSSFITSES